MIKRGDKLYCITRRDLSLGQQAVQLTHSSLNFAIEHPKQFKAWHKNSNFLCLLSVDSLTELEQILNSLKNLDIKYSLFFEEDINNELTYITLEASESSKIFCSKLKLAFS
jgi:hypothetical protein